MAFELAFNPPQFTEEYDGRKMRQLVEEIERLHSILTADTVDGIRTGNFDILEATNLFMRESAAGLASRAGWGQFWVDEANPNLPRFTDGAGNVFQLSRVAYAGISVIDNTNTITLNSAAHTQIIDFNTNDPSIGVTPEHASDHLVVLIGGDYFVNCSVAVKNSSGTPHIIHVEVKKNNGAVDVLPAHAHRSLPTASDIGSISLSGIATLEANDTIELWASTDSGTDRNVTFEDVVLTIVRVN